MYENKIILVTGGTGSWGVELIQQLLNYHPKKIIIFSRNESSQVALRSRIKDTRLIFFIGDIRDKAALISATVGVDYLFHLAALKHVPICEDNPLESIKTNVIGTQNVIDVAIENNIKKVIYISTDKAADPVNTYGMTKALGEKLILHANEKGTTTQFFCVRGGNVLGSSGSVLPIFRKQITDNGEIHITDKRMVRFFITPQDAIATLLKASKIGVGGEIFVMNMDAFKIIDLAEVMIEHSGQKDIKIVETGIRKGEKIKEILLSDSEKDNAIVFDKDLLIISPTSNGSATERVIEGKTQTLEKPLLSKNEIHALLTKGKLL